MEVFGDVVLRFYVPALFGALLDLAPVVLGLARFDGHPPSGA